MAQKYREMGISFRNIYFYLSNINEYPRCNYCWDGFNQCI